MTNMNDDKLKNVTGGAGTADESKKAEFEKAWYGLGMEAKGLTGTDLEDQYTQWQLAGYKPDARTFLQNSKTL